MEFLPPELASFVSPRSRAGKTVPDVLGTDYQSLVVSDFYAGYNSHLGLHPRGWVPLLREVHDLRQKYPTAGVQAGAKRSRALYDPAKACSPPDRRQRAQARVRFQAALVGLATPYVEVDLPQSTLCQRLLTFESELFPFVEYPEVPCENNACARCVLG